jgi:hypothetical protein
MQTGHFRPSRGAQFDTLIDLRQRQFSSNFGERNDRLFAVKDLADEALLRPAMHDDESLLLLDEQIRSQRRNGQISVLLFPFVDAPRSAEQDFHDHGRFVLKRVILGIRPTYNRGVGIIKPPVREPADAYFRAGVEGTPLVAAQTPVQRTKNTGRKAMVQVSRPHHCIDGAGDVLVRDRRAVAMAASSH